MVVVVLIRSLGDVHQLLCCSFLPKDFALHHQKVWHTRSLPTSSGYMHAVTHFIMVPKAVANLKGSYAEHLTSAAVDQLWTSSS